MNQHYTTKILAATLLLLIGITGKAQHVEYLNANNVNAGIPIGGNLFFKADTASVAPAADTLLTLFEVPKGSGMRAAFSSSIWMAAQDAGGNLHCSSQKYIQDEFFDGPIAATYNQAYYDYYKRVFKITRSQVNAHLAQQFPVGAGQVSNALLMWPGKGNPHVLSILGVNINNALAPFVDVNGDNNYDPATGDYPDFCGEEAVFFVFNDVNGPVGPTGMALGVEVRGLAEVHIDNTSSLAYEKRALNNTLFVRYEVQNKSADNYTNFYFSEFEDMDLGCFNNDRIGCDTTLNLMLGYNAQGLDPDCQGITGYGTKSVAHGIKFLNKELTAFGYVNNDNSLRGDPNTAVQYFNNMQGKWNDGTPYVFGGDGLNGANNTPTSHLFPGNPNVPEEWSELHPQAGPYNAAGDRRVHGTAGPMSLAAGEIKIFDLAFFVSYDSNDTSSLANYRIVDTLKRDADLLQSFYDNSILPCRAAQQPVGIAEMQEGIIVKVFPNPASSNLNIQCDRPISVITLMDIAGNRLLVQSVNSFNTSLDVSKLAKGIYLLQLSVGNNTTTRKVVVD